jgi:Zn-dependent protease with chaperone function
MGDLPMGDLPVVLVWPMLTSALLGWAAPRLARALPPALAVRLLAAGAVICAASTTLVLALTAWLLLAEIPVVAALGHWSAPQVDLRQPVPDIVEALAGAAWVVMIGRVSAATVSFTRSTLACRRTCADLGGSPADLVIIESVRPEAYAVADGLTGGGRIVVSTGLLAALSPAERRVVFAHEAAHLHGRHHVWRALADVAAAANPLLSRISGAVCYGTERWADEDTAQEVGDRRLAARALARAALAAGPIAPGPAMGLVGYGVRERVESLLGPPPPRRRLVTVLIGVLVAVTLAAATDADLDTGHFLDQAGRLCASPQGLVQTAAPADRAVALGGRCVPG